MFQSRDQGEEEESAISVAVHDFASRVLISFSVDETLLPS